MDWSQPGIVNATDVRFNGGMKTSGVSPGDNAVALFEAIQEALNYPSPVGAIVLIPSVDNALNGGTYNIDTSDFRLASHGYSIEIAPSTATPLLICGTGSTILEIVTPPDPETGDGRTLFNVQNSWVAFQDLTINFNAGSDNKGLGTAFSFNSSASFTAEGCSLWRLYITDCQYPVIFDGVKSCSMRECFVYYDYSGSQTANIPDLKALQVVGGATGSCIEECVFHYHHPEDIESGGTFYGFYIDESSGTRVHDTQLADFQVGISIQSATPSSVALGVAFTGSRISAFGRCLVVGPVVRNLSFTDCYFAASTGWESGGVSETQVGISIGAAGDENNQIDGVRFMSCSLTGNNGTTEYGLQIAAGQAIQIHGGVYSGNGSAGILIAGGFGVQIFGANCTGVELGEETQSIKTPIYQTYGIQVTGGSDIQIIGVNCSANGLPDSPPTPGTGIMIQGSSEAPVTGVLIVGAICTNPTFPSESSISQEYGISVEYASSVIIKDCAIEDAESNGSSGSGYAIYLANAQEVVISTCDLFDNAGGVYVADGCSDLAVRNCNVKGYAAGGAITVASSVSDFEVTECAGYNTQAGEITATVPVGNFSGASEGYFGPVVFYVVNAAMTIQGHSTGLSSGSFTLNPGGAQLASLIPLPSTKFIMFS